MIKECSNQMFMLIRKMRCAAIAGLLLLFLCTPVAGIRAEAASPQKEIFDILMDDGGLKPAAASGILANIAAESGFNAGITGLGGGYGLCQWGGARLTGLRNYCSSNGYNSSTAAGQAHYIIYELQNTYPKVYSYLKGVSNNAQGAYDAAYYFCAYYEIPAARFSASAYRGQLARNTYWPLYGSTAAYLTASASGGGIKLTWTGLSSGKLRVMRSSKKNGTYKKVADLSKGTKTYTDKSSAAGSASYYYVALISSNGKELKRSNKVAVTRKRSLEDDNVSITLQYTSVKYNGKARKPNVTVEYGSTRLKKNRDYTVSYKNNTKAGTASVVIKGKGKYSGSVTKKFKITRIPWKIKAADKTVKLSRKTWKPSLSVTGLSKKVYAKRIKLSSSNTDVAKVSGLTLKLKGKGTAKIKVTVQGNKDHKQTSTTFTLTVQ